MKKANKFHPLRLIAVAGYSLGVISLAIAMVLGVTPAATTYGQESISCPLPGPNEGQLVDISAGPFLRSDRSEAEAKIGPVAASIPAGTYEITLASYDNHDAHVGPNQPNERWFLILLDSSGVEITRSQSINDLPESTNWLVQVTDSNLVVSRDVASVVAYHTVYPDRSNPNSVIPVCGSVAVVQVEPTSVPATDVPPPEATSESGLIPVTGIDLNVSSGTTNGLFTDLGIVLLGVGFLMLGAWLHFSKAE